MSDRADGVVVTEATEEDVAAFAEFFRTAWEEAGPEAPGFAGATDDVIRELTTREAILERIGGPDRRLYLAWVGGRVRGFSATKRLEPNTVELSGIIVLRDWAGRGVGTPLVEAAADHAREEGYRRMVVRTETSNERAVGFYEARGFARSGTTTEDVEGASIDVYELVRDLD